MNKETDFVTTSSFEEVIDGIRDKAIGDCITIIQNFTPKSFPTTFEKIIEELNKLKSNEKTIL